MTLLWPEPCLYIILLVIIYQINLIAENKTEIEESHLISIMVKGQQGEIFDTSLDIVQ
jgi:hypothetical protein